MLLADSQRIKRARRAARFVREKITERQRTDTGEGGVEELSSSKKLKGHQSFFTNEASYRDDGSVSHRKKSRQILARSASE